eukprot:TRINITY_DN1596_c0_g1_i4.p1 TRINITY_DN1596_c0_g1~~TRINITY_DN1596_c0_g1_i4.p1  ORF type:complete len:717 (+),score=111.82 TRINITY_DN1596_c0_g1_i4:67-2217(+)
MLMMERLKVMEGDPVRRSSTGSSSVGTRTERSMPNVLNMQTARPSSSVQHSPLLTGATMSQYPLDASSLDLSRATGAPIETTRLIQIRSTGPYIGNDDNVPEFTLRAVIFSIILSIILGCANAYLGLLAGVTITASIPASVIAMGVMRFFPSGSILELNVAQTGAAVGTSIMSGIIYTMPALIINGYISKLDIWETTAVAALGSMIGILVSNPLRRIFILEQNLLFPEGVAIAELLKAGHRSNGTSLRPVLIGTIIGGIFKFMMDGLKLWKSVAQTASYVGSSVLFMGLNYSPALSGVGFIIGIQNCLIFFAGGLLNWWIILPIYAAVKDDDDARQDESAQSYAFDLWSKETRFVGVGAVLVAGLHTLFTLRSNFVQLWIQGFRNYLTHGEAVTRTDKEIPMPWTAAGLLLTFCLAFPLFWHFSGDPGIAFMLSVLIFVAGTLFSSINAYIAGKIGSSNAPASGMTLASILIASLLLSAYYTSSNDDKGPYLSILVGAVVCTAAAFASDCQQDLKAGYMLGSTPYKLQMIQAVGILPPVILSPYVINLLVEVYGIEKDEDLVGEQDNDGTDPLPAPQASLMAAIIKNVFEGNTPWEFIYIGMGFAIVVLVVDHVLEVYDVTKVRFPLLSTAIGIYVPIEVTGTIFLGGMANWVGGRLYLHKEKKAASTHEIASIRELKAQGGKYVQARLYNCNMSGSFLLSFFHMFCLWNVYNYDV